MIVFPNAKINLGLNITEKRSDGFHNLVSCFYPIGWSDALEVVENKKTVFNSSGLSIPPDGKENLVVRAFKMLKKDFQLPHLSIHLHKVIPTGAGLGGGSSDAAYMLNMINKMYNLYLDESFLMQYAAELGSDCSFFIPNQPAIVTGRGDELKEIDFSLKGRWLVLVYPAIHISTKEAYSGITPQMTSAEELEALILKGDLSEWRHYLKNDFEAHLFKNYPELATIKETLYQAGASYAAMSGSGSTVFGLFESEPDLKNCGFDPYTIWKEQLSH